MILLRRYIGVSKHLLIDIDSEKFERATWIAVTVNIQQIAATYVTSLADII